MDMLIIKNAVGKEIGRTLATAAAFKEAKRRLRGGETIWIEVPTFRKLATQTLHKHDKVTRPARDGHSRCAGEHSEVLTHYVQTGTRQQRVY